MQHVLVFSFFLSICVGAVTLAISLYLSIKTGDTFQRSYTVFYLSFSMLIIMTLGKVYLTINAPDTWGMLAIVMQLLEIISLYSLVYTTPLISHSLFETSRSRIRNSIFAGLALVAATWLLYSLRGTLHQRLTSYISRWFISESIFLAVQAYIVFQGITRFKSIVDPFKKKVSLHTILLLVFFLPGIVNDFFRYLPLPDAFHFFPFLYAGFSIMYSYHVITRYLRLDRGESVIELDDSFFGRYEISPRERDVCSLIVKGYDNARIADALCISLSTVKKHVYTIFKKTGATSRFDLVRTARDFYD
jgi:DNA-binding CsgD family transcriptional regulator